MSLPINIDDLLSARLVESERIEFKKGWNPDAIYRSICAFANDFENIGGGYIFVGVEEDEVTHVAKRPVKGLSTAEIASIQKEMIGYNNLMKPYYAPKLSIEQVDGKDIIVLWAVAGSERPYEVPEQITAKHKSWTYFIRKYANSIEAKTQDKEELIALANNIPFDDRSNTQAKLEHISMILVKDYLMKVKSRLAVHVGKQSDREILGQMQLISGPNEHVFPRNVALMMFSENPDKFFPATRVEVVYFPEGDASDFTEYPPIEGPVPSQIKKTLDLLRTNFLKEKVVKPQDRAESTRIWNYPLQAIEETLVNAFYHRDYQQREPIEIRIYPHSMVFLNHGGPDRSIQMQSFTTGQVRSRRYRNRRLGEFLKELELTEGRATGIPTILKVIKENGSPAPSFNSDPDRTYFEVELRIHPAFEPKPPLTALKTPIVASLGWIDAALDEILDHAEVSDGVLEESAQAHYLEIVDIQATEVVATVDSAIASALALVITDTLTANEIKVLQIAKMPINRQALLRGLGVTNHRKNYLNTMLPLIESGWLSMTLPDKPTSPNQQYFTTLKGRLVLDLIKHDTK